PRRVQMLQTADEGEEKMKLRTISIYAVATALAMAATAYVVIWLLGERIISRKYQSPWTPFAHSTDSLVVSEGKRLAAVAGCSGCHNDDLNGGLFGESPFIYRSVTANLPRLAMTYTNEDFARAIRHGIKKNKRSVIGMPSPAFYNMRDEDLAAIISYIRTMPDKGAKLPTNELWILGRLEVSQGLYPPEASQIDHFKKRRVFDFADPVQHGAYIAAISCAECHGLAFKGDPYAAGAPGAPPDLVVASGYELEQFRHLMRTGEPVSGRDLRLMDDVARDRFVSFTDAEIDALHSFLVDRAQHLNE
ncbi:MAG: cytochrome c, partial [Amphiplicatus sp.]